MPWVESATPIAIDNKGVELIPLEKRLAGVMAQQKIAVPAGAKTLFYVLDRASWVDFKQSVEVVIEYSPDGRAWKQIGGFSCQCGPCSYDGVTPINEVSGECPIPDEKNERAARISILPSLGDVTTKVVMKAY